MHHFIDALKFLGLTPASRRARISDACSPYIVTALDAIDVFLDNKALCATIEGR